MATSARQERPPARALGAGVLRRTLALFLPYRRRIALAISAILVSSALGTMYPLLIRAALDRSLLCGPECPRVRLLLAQLGVLLLVIGGEAALNGFQMSLATSVGQSVMFDLRQGLYEGVKRMPLDFFTSTRSADIQSRLLNDVRGVEQLVTSGMQETIAGVVIVISATVAMLIMSWQLTLLSIAVIPVFGWLTRRASVSGERRWRDVQRGYSELTDLANEALSIHGALLGKLFGREEEDVQQFRGVNLDLRRRLVRANLNEVLLRSALGSYLALAPAVILVAVLVFNLGGRTTTAGTVLAFITLQTRLFGPAAELFSGFVRFRSAGPMLRRIFEYRDLRSALADPSDDGATTAVTRGAVELTGVTFSYPQTSSPALVDVSLRVEPGQFAAIVGPTGAGKTTVAYLLARLYDVDAGAIRIDGRDVRELSRATLTATIGMVTQETHLVHASVLENLRYAKPGATRAEIEAAARAAYIHGRVMRLPQGYDTIVGEEGFRLSGGEKQRISIARTLLRDPRILILDEATSALDTRSERVVQRALAKLMQGRTTIAIAHRLSTIVNADVIYVLDQGRVVERGSHEQLLAAGGVYARLHHEQFKAAEAEPAPPAR